jgi:hypothetical protein
VHYKTLFQAFSFSDLVGNDSFVTYLSNNHLLSGRRRRYERFLVYNDIRTQWYEEYVALNATEKRDWVKNKVAERELIRDVCAL